MQFILIGCALTCILFGLIQIKFVMRHRNKDKNIRQITDKLDSVGNTTAAIGKGFSIGSAALTALALFTTYANTVHLGDVNVLDPKGDCGFVYRSYAGIPLLCTRYRGGFKIGSNSNTDK